jgi:hypothetical protein
MGISNQTEPERNAFNAAPCRERGSIPRPPCGRQGCYRLRWPTTTTFNLRRPITIETGLVPSSLVIQWAPPIRGRASGATECRVPTPTAAVVSTLNIKAECLSKAAFRKQEFGPSGLTFKEAGLGISAGPPRCIPHSVISIYKLLNAGSWWHLMHVLLGIL